MTQHVAHRASDEIARLRADADRHFHLLADIRAAAGLGAGPMLGELVDCIARLRAEIARLSEAIADCRDGGPCAMCALGASEKKEPTDTQLARYHGDVDGDGELA